MQKIGLLIFFIFSVNNANATKFPNLYFDIKGRVVESDTKVPVSGAKILGFLNGSPYSDNTGWRDDNDFPALPESQADGSFVAKAVLMRGQKTPRELKVELIALKQGYRTERFVFTSTDFLLPGDPNSRGTIRTKDIEIFKTKKP